MTARSLALGACLALLAGCEAPADPPPDADAPAALESPARQAQAGDRIVAPAEILGEFRIAGVDETALDLPYGVTASISGERIHVVADCLNFGWDYEFDGGVLTTERIAVESCGRGPNPQEEAIVAAFDAASQASRNRSNGIELSGEGHTVTLFSQ